MRQFKCYGDADLRLNHGVTVVHGVNGSGKSTLLEAVFFALYGSKALDDRTLDDVITTGADECEVELWFTHAGGDYRIERRLKRRGDRATTTKCVLDGPDGSIDGARDVRRYVTDLLRMDAEAFVNCAYVRQGEVNKLIHASPGDRQDMIDDLLQLGALEVYRERASDARLGVKTVLDGQRERARGVREQIEAKEAKDLHERLNGLESRRTELSGDIERFEANQQAARQTRTEAVEILDRHEEIRDEIETLEREIEELHSTITETETERETLNERIQELRSEREEKTAEREELVETVGLEGESISSRIESLTEEDERLRERLEELRLDIQDRSNTIERLRERADEFADEAATARENASELTEAIEADERTITERVETLAELDDTIERARAVFDDAPVEFGDADEYRAGIVDERDECRAELADVRAQIDATEEAIANGMALLEAGKCPECGQPVEDSPHVDVLEERRETLSDLEEERDELEDHVETLEARLDRAKELREAEQQVERFETNRDTVQQLIDEKRETLEDRRAKRDELLARADDREERTESKRQKATELAESVADVREELESVNSQRQSCTGSLESLRQAETLSDRIDTIEAEIETLRDRRSSKAELNEERRRRLSEKRARHDDLTAEFDEASVETARNERDKAEDYLDRVEEKLEELRQSREEVQNAIGGVKNELDELETLRERLATVEARCENLESLYEEAETLQATYGDLRAELRQRNVETLERMLNETFELVYQNDSYAGIDLDGEYRLTVYQKDGEPLEPEQLSGGERALFNLSLRCAIYRLLAEGVEGSAPMPPLILDEPTVFLDSGHVTQLVSLVESMRELGVEQIVVVSHDLELVGAADDLIRVRKDSTTNRSRLERGEQPIADALTVD